jgi:uncharacterized protein (DUF427 family)
VWDYPRPPAVAPSTSKVTVIHRGVTIVDTAAPIRVLETSQAPGFYLPPSDIRMDLMTRSSASSFCEWKGIATYWTLTVGGETFEDVAWSYDSPTPPFSAITGYLAFYPQRVDRCSFYGELVEANAGSFYGGWITSNVVGPFKGAAGTLGW